MITSGKYWYMYRYNTTGSITVDSSFTVLRNLYHWNIINSNSGPHPREPCPGL